MMPTSQVEPYFLVTPVYFQKTVGKGDKSQEEQDRVVWHAEAGAHAVMLNSQIKRFG